jgi:DNA-nicking Smr family endonuclease
MRKPTDDDIKAFRDAVDGARPIKHEPRVPPKRRKPAPKAHFRRRAEVEVLEDSLLLTPEDLEVEAADELSFRRNGIQDTVMRNLRRGYYRVEDALDLHGMTQREAKSELRDFLARATAQHLRCLRIVHARTCAQKCRQHRAAARRLGACVLFGTPQRRRHRRDLRAAARPLAQAAAAQRRSFSAACGRAPPPSARGSHR